MSKSARLNCYRVPVYRTGRYLEPIIAAPSAAEAQMKARELAGELLRRRLPWLMENGVSRPAREVELPIEVGLPRVHHRRGNHK